MTELKCDVIHCASNNNHRCCRPEIQVDGKHAQDRCDTCCASFSAIVGQGVQNSVDYSRPNTHMPIACTAENCRYNESGKCEATQVHMLNHEATNEAQTECGTFSCESCC